MLLYGLEHDRDFAQVSSRLLVSCPSDGPDEGGLFLLDFAGNQVSKLYTGGCTGFVQVNGALIVATDTDELLSLDREFNVAARCRRKKSDYHGVAAYGNSAVLAVETARNRVGCYDVRSLARTGEILFSPLERDIFHINDIWIEGDALYVSMFSPREKWFADPLRAAGAIARIDLTGFRPDMHITADLAEHLVAGELHMPHSVTWLDGQLAYCDSMAFRIVCGGMEVSFPGFTRGLALSRGAIFVGQSRMRHILRIPHRFSNCSLDAGIHVYLPEHRISRFVPLPAQQVYHIAEFTAGEVNA